ncbi:MAG: 5-(carboxyamino)imidazole ribonucleotide synthase [Alphaproteobacteria bacterium]|nr:5-(carboxyamino)imidazole ribonucleotide synthase [Alphaproteobacteria bacterium]
MTAFKTLSAPVAPGGTIGILGGGQLGRMLAMAAARLGLRTHIYSDTEKAPAFQVSAGRSLAAYDDEAALAEFARACDAVTFEFENVPGQTAAFLARLVPVNPGPRALAISQERYEEKRFVAGLGLKTAPFAAIDSRDDIAKAIKAIGCPAVLKTRRMGYDGKGQATIRNAKEAMEAFDRFQGVPLILEGFVDFAFEASVIAARGLDGSFAAYDPPGNEHENHILRRSTVPCALSESQCADAKGIARAIGEAFGYVGVFTVELFVARDGALLVNEIAPRVHNSGHWTLEACMVSQFEQHMRAVAGWPLGDPARHSNAVMENILGAEAHDWLRLAQNGSALHLYGKGEARPGRKMGHLTRLRPLTKD